MVVLTTIQKLAALARGRAARRPPSTTQQQHRQSAAGHPPDPGSDHTHEISEAEKAASRPDGSLTIDGLRRQRAAAAGAVAAAGGAWGGRVAVICDEAHRHHGKGSAEAIHSVLCGLAGLRLGGGGHGAAPAAGGKGGSGVGGSEQPPWVSYFGFTATPGPRALQLFGVRRRVLLNALGEPEDGPPGSSNAAAAAAEAWKPEQPQQPARQPRGDEDEGAGAPLTPALEFRPYHAYTLSAAISDRHVLDALGNFTALTPRMEIRGVKLLSEAQRRDLGLGVRGSGAAAGAKGGTGEEEDAAAASALAVQVLLEAAANSRALVESKAAAVADRFVEAWRQLAVAGAEGGGGSFSDHFRGMVVCRSRQHVVWYSLALRRALLERREALRPLLMGREVPGANNAGGAGDQGAAAAAAAAAAEDVDMAEAGEEDEEWWERRVEEMVYGAFSGAVGGDAPAADSGDEQAPEAAGAAAGGNLGPQKARKRGAAAGGGGSGGKQKRQKAGSAWDLSLAHLHAPPQEQQQGGEEEAESEEAESVEAESTDGGSFRSGSSTATSSSSDGETDDDASPTTSSSSDLEADSCSGSDNQQGSLTSWPSGSAAEALAVAGKAPQRLRRCRSSSIFGSFTQAAAVVAAARSVSPGNDDPAPPPTAGKPPLQPSPVAAAAVARTRGGGNPPRATRRAVRRDASLLSSGTSLVPAQPSGSGPCDTEEGEGEEVGTAAAAAAGTQPPPAAASPTPDKPEAAAAAAAAAASALPAAVGKVTESELNGSRKDPSAARLLVVCSKYETGYDDPRLAMMFVDRPLMGERWGWRGQG